MRIVSALCKRMIYPALAKSGYLRKHSLDNAPAVLTYHGVVPSGYESIDRDLDGALVSVEALERQLIFLSRHYELIAPEDFRLWILGKVKLPSRSVLLTCDDGQKNQSLRVLPILKSLGISCLFFVVGSGECSQMLWHEALFLMLRSKMQQSRGNRFVFDAPWLMPLRRVRNERELRSLYKNLIGSMSRLDDQTRERELERIRTALELERDWNRDYWEDAGLRERFFTMTRSEMREITSAGMTLGSHSLSHAELSRLSAGEARKEIARSRQCLMDALGTPVWAFAYPFGGPGSFGARECREVKAAGYACAFTNGVSTWVGCDGRFSLPRIHVTRSMDMAEFEAHVSGFYSRVRSGIAEAAEVVSLGESNSRRGSTRGARSFAKFFGRRQTAALSELSVEVSRDEPRKHDLRNHRGCVMRVLVLHPEDGIECAPEQAYDLIVDLGRAPRATYDRWQKTMSCPVLSLLEFSGQMDDFRELRSTLQAGIGSMVDEHGLDWWELLKLDLVKELLQIRLLSRLAKEIAQADEIWVSRWDFRARALTALLDREVSVIRGGSKLSLRVWRRYRDALLNPDRVQLAQVFRDKFDPRYQVRRRFARAESSSQAEMLIPSPYINVSRAGLNYATRNPEQRFVMMYVRASAKSATLPANMRASSLDGYFSAEEPQDLTSLSGKWKRLESKLAGSSDEFHAAQQSGILNKIPALLAQGLFVRDAWLKAFQLNNFTGCFCADDSNVSTRLPLIFAQQRGLSAIASHHGALDSFMAVKELYGGYVAKTELEHDYLTRQCLVPAERITLRECEPAGRLQSRAYGAGQCLTFFTEPYGLDSWRIDEVYRDLLPHLMRVAEVEGLRLVFKVHPFESARGHRRQLRRHLSAGELAEVDVIEGAIPESLWADTRVAMAVESSIAVECHRRGIPIFLCGWLKAPFYEYQEQFARFGAGRVLERVEDIARLPDLLAALKHDKPTRIESLSVDSLGVGSRSGLAAQGQA